MAAPPKRPTAARQRADRSWLTFFAAGLKTLETLEAFLARRGPSAAARRRGCFGHISLDTRLFLRDLCKAHAIMELLKPDRPCRFLDVGCGVGVKVQIAGQVFAHADGLEYDRAFHRVACAIQNSALNEGVAFIHEDALKFQDWHAYDVVYLYRPMKDVAKQSQLEEQIAGHLAENAVLIAHKCSFDRFHRSARPGCASLQPLFDNIYLNSTPRRARMLQAELAQRSNQLSTLWW